ncbi:hypothetical protein GCM10011346_40170 [Oceanobacillus neutriphilus]|uniref:Uncharacterized protein n=1 Tax=Oceanobacillus neutriphilus TaxID=531815 RepID=A0ABQ2P073_9BACI|nr:hypothetical protein GCM10011346_40170 [Oceanobacillus neutriphilus]
MWYLKYLKYKKIIFYPFAKKHYLPDMLNIYVPVSFTADAPEKYSLIKMFNYGNSCVFVKNKRITSQFN